MHVYFPCLLDILWHVVILFYQLDIYVFKSTSNLSCFFHFSFSFFDINLLRKLSMYNTYFSFPVFQITFIPVISSFF